MNFVSKESSLLKEKYLFAKHKTGLEIVVIPKDHQKVYAIIGTRYGAMDRTFKTNSDPDFITVPDGIAHFLEHKMFENEDGSDTFSLFADKGGNANAFTSNDMTAYLFSATDNYYENLEILLNFVTKPYFTKETVEKEQGIIAQEIRMYEDNPYRQLYFGLIESLYVKSNVRIEVAGTVESISHITPEILYRCYNTFYNLNNMTLVLCGDFDVQKVVEVCDKVLVQSNNIDIIKDVPEEPAQINVVRVVEKFPISLPMFMFGLKETDIDINDSSEKILKRNAEHEIITDMLFGKSSDFYNDLYESGLLNEKFYCGYNLAQTYSYVTAQGESREPDKIFKLAKEAIESIKKDNFINLKREDFERSKKAVYAKNVTDWNSTTGIAEGFLDLHFIGADMLDMAQSTANVTFDDIKERLIKSYDTSLMAISIVEPMGGQTN